LIAGGWLYWPTQDANLPYRTVTLREGAQTKGVGTASVLPEPSFFDPTMFAAMPAGNWAFGQGCLAIAGLNELVVYTPPRIMPQGPIERPHARIDALYQRARVHAYHGDKAAAQQAYQDLLGMTKQQPRADEWRKFVAARLADLEPPVVPKMSAMPAKQPAREPHKADLRLHLPLVRVWQRTDGRAWPMDDADYFVCTKPGQASWRRLRDGALRWQTKLDIEPTSVERRGECVLFVGADGVQAVRVADGKAMWSYAAPSRRWPHASLVSGVPTLKHLAAGIVHAQLWGDTLLVLDDNRRFVRLRLDNGEIAWQYAAPAADFRPLDAATFSPHVVRVGDQLLAQNGAGQPLRLGTKSSPVSEKSRPWVQAPCVSDGRVFIAGERGVIRAFDLAKPAAPVWTFEAGYPTSLTGALCELYAQGSVLLARVSRNIGADWIRIDTRTGKLIWSFAASSDERMVSSLCIGDTAFYQVINDNLTARSLNDGRLLWSQALAPNIAYWHLRYTPEAVAIYPATARDDDFAVSFLDPFDGRWLQRLTLANARGNGAVVWTPDGMIASLGSEVFGFRSLNTE